MNWPKLDFEKINSKISEVLGKNLNYEKNLIFGVPGSWLNRKAFPSVDFLKEAPFLRAMVANPNHIGCHTMGRSEKLFEGTHFIEREVLRICAEEILEAEEKSYDGYIASGGTEGNIQAIWVYRNYFNIKMKIPYHQMKVACSQDTHYSIHKACNLLGLEDIIFKVDEKTRQILQEDLQNKIHQAMAQGTKALILVLSMGTTMFGSVDKIEAILEIIKNTGIKFFVHIDAAFGGFIYPFSGLNKLTFKRPEISSFSMDGHKILQSPYGTGVFLIRKPLIDYVSNEKASYVQGFDQTLCGSRSGALPIAMWMILSLYGREGWNEFIRELLLKTDRLAEGLQKKKLTFFREEGINVITVPTGQIETKLLEQYHWVSDNESSPRFYKAVIMDHVESKQINNFLDSL